MTFILWTGAGFVAAAAVLHAAIGLRRPFSWANISFAFAMVFLALYLIGQSRSFAARSDLELIAVERGQFIFSAGLVAMLGWFTREFTGVRVPLALVVVFYGAIAFFVGADLMSPYGGFMGSPPVLLTVETIGGQRATVYDADIGPLQAAWLALVGLLLLWAIAMGVRLVRSGGRRRGLIFIASLLLMLGFPIVDVVLGTRSPHFGALGVLGLALIMSIDMAADFRAKDAELLRAVVELEERSQRISRILETSMALRDQLNTPLQTLELDLDILARIAPDMATRLARVQRNLDRLTELGARLQEDQRPAGAPRR